MADDVVGTCCSLILVACLDVTAGICTDFIGIREFEPAAPSTSDKGLSGHGCTERILSCNYCQHEEEAALEFGENDPLLSQRVSEVEPRPQPPMNIAVK